MQNLTKKNLLGFYNRKHQINHNQAKSKNSESILARVVDKDNLSLSLILLYQMKIKSVLLALLLWKGKNLLS